MQSVGKSVARVDAFDKATGRAKYTDDLCDRNALITRVVRSTVAHGIVTSIAGKRACVGSAHFIFEDEAVPEPDGLVERINREAPTASTVAPFEMVMSP